MVDAIGSKKLEDAIDELKEQPKLVINNTTRLEISE
jgi:hypothetical protein